TPANYMGQLGFDTSAIYTPDGTKVFIGGATAVLESTDSGKTWTDVTVDSKGNAPHADVHVLFLSGNTLLTATDGGLWGLNTGAPKKTWTDLNGNLSIAQINGVAGIPSTPTTTFAGTQAAGIDQYSGTPVWSAVDTQSGSAPFGGQVVVDPNDPNTVYAFVNT